MRRTLLLLLLVAASAAMAAKERPDSRRCPVAAANLFPVRSWLPPPLPPPPPPPPQAPSLPFVYIGQMQEGKGLAVFLGRQQQTLIVRAGDTVDGTYRVDELTPTMATFTYLPLDQKQQLPLRNTP